jgi:hypothetical protein
MRIPIAIVVGAALIAGAIATTNRCTVGHVLAGSKGYWVMGTDSWTGKPFASVSAFPPEPASSAQAD